MPGAGRSRLRLPPTKATALPTASPAPSEPRDVVLHIGTGKTGTSSVQQFLHLNRVRLAEQGILYPRTPGPRRHLRLGLYIRTDDELDAQMAWHTVGGPTPAKFRRRFERRFLRELDDAGCPRVLLSDEALYGASPEALQRLRGLTDRIARTLRLVVYLRRQDDHLRSRYQQVVKTGEVRRFVDRVAAMDYTTTYDYHARLRLWQRLIEPTEFVVRPFEREGFPGGSLVQDFLDAAGLELRAADLEQVPTLNQSLDAESVEFLRILNLYRVEHEGARPNLIDNRAYVARLAAASTGPTLTVPNDVLEDFMARWEESNRAVARDFLGGEALFRAPRRSANATDRQYLDPSRIDHFIGLLELPARMHAPLRALAEREAEACRGV